MQSPDFFKCYSLFLSPAKLEVQDLLNNLNKKGGGSRYFFGGGST